MFGTHLFGVFVPLRWGFGSRLVWPNLAESRVAPGQAVDLPLCVELILSVPWFTLRGYYLLHFEHLNCHSVSTLLSLFLGQSRGYNLQQFKYYNCHCVLMLLSLFCGYYLLHCKHFICHCVLTSFSLFFG